MLNHKSLFWLSALALLVTLLPRSALACYCADKPGGGFICEAHCSPGEIETKLGPGHGPVEMVSGALSADNLSGNPAGGGSNEGGTTAGGGTTTGGGNGSGSGSSNCYMSSTGDFVCPQQEGTSAGSTPNTGKPGIGGQMPQPTANNPSPTNPTGSTGGGGGSSPVNSGNAGSAYGWPPGFGCAGADGMVGPPPVGQNPADWKMTFEDEFNALDTNLWDDEWTSPKGQANTVVEGGILKIFPIPGADLSRNYKHLKTDDVFEQQYGYFEAEMKLPVGKGTWPAFWLYQNNGPADWRPEIDVMEAYSGGGPDSGWSDANLHPITYAPTVWRGSPGDMAGSKMVTPGMDLSAGFHTYAVKWEPNKQTYYFDGQPVYELDIGMPDPMFLALSFQFGSASGPGDSSTPTGKGNAFEVKYVRAWEKCGGPDAPTTSAPVQTPPSTPPAAPAPVATPSNGPIVTGTSAIKGSCQNPISGPAPMGQTPSDWKLVFADEFNAYDSSMWNDHIWYEGSNATKNYTVEDGALKIWPQRDGSGNFFNRTIDTDGKYYQTYGYFEMEAKLNIGRGVWPAFWLLNHDQGDRPEIDIMEAYPGGGPGGWWGDENLHPNNYAANVWPTGIGRGNAGERKLRDTVHPNGLDLSTGFHTYAAKWDPDGITFYFDGKQMGSKIMVGMPNRMYILLDLWFGSASGNPDNSTPQGKANSYVVNYVRAWQQCR